MMTNPYDSKVLDPTVHGRLVAEIDAAASFAGIQAKWIWTRLGDICSPEEVTWVKRFKFHKDEDRSMLAYVGRDSSTDPEVRMSAVAGALTRNFITARVLTVNQVLDTIKEGKPPLCSCLLIPNFFIEKSLGGGIAHWQSQVLHDLLLDRSTRGLQTVVYVTDMASLGAEYGKAIMKHIQSHSQLVDIDD